MPVKIMHDVDCVHCTGVPMLPLEIPVKRGRRLFLFGFSLFVQPTLSVRLPLGLSVGIVEVKSAALLILCARPARGRLRKTVRHASDRLP